LAGMVAGVCPGSSAPSFDTLMTQLTASFQADRSHFLSVLNSVLSTCKIDNDALRPVSKDSKKDIKWALAEDFQADDGHVIPIQDSKSEENDWLSLMPEDFDIDIDILENDMIKTSKIAAEHPSLITACRDIAFQKANSDSKALLGKDLDMLKKDVDLLKMWRKHPLGVSLNRLHPAAPITVQSAGTVSEPNRLSEVMYRFEDLSSTQEPINVTVADGKDDTEPLSDPSSGNDHSVESTDPPAPKACGHWAAEETDECTVIENHVDKRVLKEPAFCEVHLESNSEAKPFERDGNAMFLEYAKTTCDCVQQLLTDGGNMETAIGMMNDLKKSIFKPLDSDISRATPMIHSFKEKVKEIYAGHEGISEWTSATETFADIGSTSMNKVSNINTQRDSSWTDRNNTQTSPNTLSNGKVADNDNDISDAPIISSSSSVMIRSGNVSVTASCSVERGRRRRQIATSVLSAQPDDAEVAFDVSIENSRLAGQDSGPGELGGMSANQAEGNVRSISNRSRRDAPLYIIRSSVTTPSFERADQTDNSHIVQSFMSFIDIMLWLLIGIGFILIRQWTSDLNDSEDLEPVYGPENNLKPT